MPGEHLIVLCTCPRGDVALRLAEALVDRELAACVNIVPTLTSVYRWQGKRESAEEALLVIKTRARLYADLEQALQAMHPYELPEIVAVTIECGLAAYLSWVDASVGG